MVTSGQHQDEIWVDKRRSGLPEPDEDDGGMKELVGTFLLPSLFSLPGCVLFSLVLLASSEDWFSHYFSYTYVQSHSLNEQQAQ